ncbi:HNH endonuclease [Halogranum tailed virus 1]|uniref:C2H2-type domain-containing protein n=1 Tax=Halogranum tailed virus 1 TaxID=1273749 RepID=R4TMX2_9CAUD|nr:HNH endonuclease [Halogranum tailed virus 1]AGM11543.1 hypothetical protein HGTV1_246 [Halogranum tailed virus 1]
MSSDCPSCDRSFGSQKGMKIHHAKAHGEKITESHICQECDEPFEQESYIQSDKKYCSPECVYEARKDRLTTECANCGEPVTKKRQRIERVDTVYCDEDCWREALPDPSFRDSQAAKNFRESVFERDDYICQDCDEQGVTLNAHHIERVSENEQRAYDTDNGVTLCVSCHIERHESAGENNAARLLRSKYETLK